MTETSSELSFISRIGIALLVAGLGALLCFLPWGEAANLYLYDAMFRFRGPLPPSKQIVVVGVDDSSSGEVNLPWPWPRSLHARLLDRLFAAGARVVAFDILFEAPTQEEEDRKFAEAIDRHGKVILVSNISGFNDLTTDVSRPDEPQVIASQVTIIDPVPIRDLLTTKPLIGFDKLPQGPDGFVREGYLEAEGEKSFSALSAEVYSGKPNLLEEFKGSSPWIGFRGPGGTFTTVPYWRALDPEEYLPPNIFKDKLVFVGFAALSQFDPLNRSADHFSVPFSRWESGFMPGVEIHANIAQNLLDHTFLKVVPRRSVLVAGLFVGILAGLIFLSFNLIIAAAVYGTTAAGATALTYFFFVRELTFVSPFYLLAPLTVSFLVSPFIHYWQTKKQKDFIRKAFSTYLAPALVEELIKNRDKLELGGEEQEGTVLFLDLANFTALSEKMSPKELISFVNKNLGVLSQTILSHEGMIDKYIGDCIMAVWGIPMFRENHAWISCQAVLEILSTVEDLSRQEKESSGQILSVRAGLASGTMVAGNVGGGTQFNYTVLGNVVNLASRLEGINKFFGTTAIIGDSVARQVQEKCVLRELDLIRVKGQDTPVAIFELCAHLGRVKPEQLGVYECYARGLGFYREGSWEMARKSFAEALQIQPNDGPSRVLLLRCEEFLVSPPPESWDGVYRMLDK